MPTNGKTFKKLNTSQIIAVGNLLTQHCRKLPDGGAEYEEGWDDNRIGSEAIPEYAGGKAGAVAKIRLNIIGVLALPRMKAAVAIEAENVDLRSRVRHLEDTVNMLCLQLGVTPPTKGDLL